MNKFFKKILIIALALVCALSLFACADSDKGDKETGLFCKKIDNVYTIYKYVDDGETTSLDIAKALEDLGIDATNIKIKTQAFNGNDSLTEIIVPESVTEIEKGAFAGMKKLEKLSIPYVGMTSRSDVEVGYTADDIDNPIKKSVDSERTIAHLFGDSEYDEGVKQTINWGTGSSTGSDGTSTSQSVTCYMPITLDQITVTGNYDIPMCAFNGLTKYIKIILNDNITQIGEYAFANATQIAEIKLPTALTKIWKGAFSGASKLKTVNFTDLTKLTEIGEKAFENTALINITMPTLADDAKTLTLGKEAFKNCKSLESLTINTKLNIGHYAFKDCDKLATVTVDSSVTAGSVTVGNYAFDGCEELKGKTVPTAFNRSDAYPV